MSETPASDVFREARGTSAPLTRLVELGCAAVLVMFAIAVNAGLLYRATLLLSKNRNEGWNAYHEQLLATTGALYHPLAAMANNNYPPLSFLTVAAMTRLIPDAVFAGRAVASAAYLLVALSIFAIVFGLYRRALPAALAAAIFLAYMAINASDYVGVNDPQMLGHALMMLGLWAGVRDRFSLSSTVLCAVLIALGLFAKHNIVALPIAVALYLLIRDRIAFAVFALAGTICAGALAAYFYLRFGPDIVANLTVYRDYSLSRALGGAIALLMPITTLILLALLNLFIPRGHPMRLLFVLYLGCAIVIGTVALAGLGVAHNAMFEAAIACALAIGCLLADPALAASTLRPWLVLAATVGTLFTPGLMLAKDVLNFPAWRALQRADAAATETLVDAIAARPGPALCENLVYCYWAGKQFEFDGLTIIPAHRAGLTPETVVLDHINAQYYASITISGEDSGMLAALSPDTFAALHAHYRELPTNYRYARIYVPAR